MKLKNQNRRVSGKMALTTLGLMALLGSSVGINAAEFNLMGGGTVSIDGAIFTTSNSQSTGTGVINSFVRLQQNGSEEGYNANARPVMPDVNTSPSFTRDLSLTDVPTVLIGGVAYREFLLDINQTAANPELSLNELQIYQRATALTTANTLAALTAAPSALVYDLDTGTDDRIQLNYNLNSGSGSGDLFVYIPNSLFSGTTGFVYLYSQFGQDLSPNATGTMFSSNDGFEEWAVRTPGGTTVPEGGTVIAMLGMGLLGLAIAKRNLVRA
jgi:hypothetical protein